MATCKCVGVTYRDGELLFKETSQRYAIEVQMQTEEWVKTITICRDDWRELLQHLKNLEVKESK